MNNNIICVKNLDVVLAEKTLLRDVSFNIGKRDKICLIGRNGCGKSTLLNVISGRLPMDAKESIIQPSLIVRYLKQEVDFSGYSSALEYVISGCAKHQIQHYGEVSYLAKEWLDNIKVKYDQSLSSLSGGQAKKIDIVRNLVGEPDLLLLDEPTNHLDINSITWLEKTIKSCNGAVVTISHDKAFLKNITSCMWWIYDQRLLAHNKGFSFFADWSEKIYLEEEKRLVRQNKLLQQENHWLAGGISARRKRNQGRLKRLQALREQKQSQLCKQQGIRLQVQKARESNSSKLIAECLSIGKQYNDHWLFNDFSVRILKGDRIGICGANGSGKSTLIQIILGKIKPDSGKVRRGITVNTAYIDQSRQLLLDAKTPWDVLCPNGGDYVHALGKMIHVVSYLKQFMFTHEQAKSPIQTLSGGEKNRLVLAKTLALESDFLILDEPTNDLDMDTLEMLQCVLIDYKGTIIIVSHDRDFLDNTVTSMIVFADDNSVKEYAGGYSDYLRQRGSQPDSTNHIKKKTSITKKDSTKSSNTTRLSFNQKYRLEQLPKLIAQLESEVDLLREQLSDSSIFVTNPVHANELATVLAEKNDKISHLEEEWFVLSEQNPAS